MNLGGNAGPGRIWHTAGSSHHPLTHSSVVVSVGGSDQNLFKTSDESLLQNVERTAVFTFGR